VVQYNQTDETQRIAVALDTYKDKTFEAVSVDTLDAERNIRDERKQTAVISILLVDDHALMREGLRQLLECEDDMRVVAEAVNGLDAMQQVRKLRPDVVLMDINMPVVDGLAVTRQITNEYPSVAVIMLTMLRQQQQVLQAMRNGARGYLLKSASSQEVVQAIRKVHEGGILIEPEVTGALVSEYRRLSSLSTDGPSMHPSVSVLTAKEIDIVRYVAAGMSNKEIAAKLVYSEKTVKNYLSIIFQKLGIRDRTQAAIFAFRQGLIPEEDM
jgi:DNA-binding NarL/FixJ family response regulator